MVTDGVVEHLPEDPTLLSLHADSRERTPLQYVWMMINTLCTKQGGNGLLFVGLRHTSEHLIVLHR